MLPLLRTRPAFRRLWLAGAVSLVGDWLSFVATSLLALHTGGGARSLAIVFAVHALPHALFAPIAGAFADRFDRRKVLALAPLAQAAITGLMAIAAARRDLAAVQALVLLRGAVGAFVVPAEAAALRHTVKPEEIVPANALMSGTWSVAFVVGMALGGPLAAIGPTTAMVLDAATFLLAAALLRGLPAMRPEGGEVRSGSLVRVIAEVPADLAAAVRYARSRPDLLRWLLGKAPIAIAGGAGWVALNLVAGSAHPFGSAAVSLGVLQAVRGAGMGIGPMIAGSAPRRFEGASMHVAAVLVFVSVAILPTVSAGVALIAIVFAWGAGGGANWVIASSGLQRIAPDRFMGRLASVDELVTTAALIGGALIGAEIVERSGSTVAAAWAGAAIGAAAWVWLFRPQREGALEAAMKSA